MALLQQPTLEKAAAAAGISSTTAWRLSLTAEFQQELHKARRKVFGQSLARMQYGSSAAVSVILHLMADPKTPVVSRLRAADSVLNHAAKATEMNDLIARVEVLEHAQSAGREVRPC